MIEYHNTLKKGGKMLNKYLGDKIFWRITARLALPIALQNLLASSFTLVDTVMVGQLGDTTLSAVGMAGQVSFMLNMVLFGICSGASVFASQYWGYGDKKGIHKVMGTTYIFALLFSVSFMLVSFFFGQHIMQIFNKIDDVVYIGQSYIKIVAFSYPAVALSLLFNTFLRSTEKVRLPMYVSFVSTVMNGFLNYALIFGKFGMPQMGARGAALATCISAWLGVILLFLISLIQKNILIAPLSDMFKLKRADVVLYLKKVVPVTFNESFWGLGTLIYAVIYSNIGYEYYASVTILRTFENIVFVFIIGLCNACGIMIGKSVGSGNIGQAVKDARRFTVVVPLVALILGWATIIFRAPLISLFNFNDNITDITIKTAMGIMLIYGLQIPIRSIPFIQIVGIFRAGGDTATAAKYDLVSLWGLAIPATFIAAFVLKLPFVAVFAIMYIFEDYLKAFLCLKHFRTKKWLRPVTKSGKEALIAYKAEN